MLMLSKSRSVQVGLAISLSVITYASIFCLRRYLEIMLHSGLIDWVFMVILAIFPAVILKIDTRLYRVCVFLVTFLLNVFVSVIAMVVLFPQFL